MKSLLQNILGCLAVGLAVSFAGAQDAASVPQKSGENPKADATSSAGNGTRPDFDAADKKSDASVPAEEPAKSTAAARQDTKPVAGDDEVKIFRLKRADATAARNLVLELYPAQFTDRSKIAADSRTNALVARGPHDLLDVIEAVLLNLDEAQTAKRAEEKGARDPRNGSAAAGGAAPSRGASARDNWVADLQTAADPDAEVTRMKEEFRRQEQQAADLARKYRHAEGAASPDDADLQKIKAALEGAVQAAFDHRQQVQRYEAEQLRLRLTRIEARLTNRERVEKEIVRQRVEQLLHPDRQWEPSDDAHAETGAAPASRASADPNQPQGTDAQAGRAPIGKPESGRPGTSSNLRKDVLDAEFAVNAARSRVAAQEKNCKFAQEAFERTREQYRAGAVTEKLMREAERSIIIYAPRLEMAKRDLQHAEAQAKLARENLDTQRKLLELDLAKAKLQVTRLANEESNVRRLFERNVVTRAELEQKTLVVEQAKLDLGRIQEQLDLYSRPIRGIAVATPDDQTPEKRESADDAPAETGAAPAGRISAAPNQPQGSDAQAGRARTGEPESDRPGKSSNPRKDVLDAEFAVSAARAKVGAEEKNCKSAQKEFEFIQKVSRTGALPEKRMREAEKNVESSAQRLEKAKLDLEHAEAQVKLARENLDAQRKLLELDMENAKLRMAHLADRETRARRLIENKAMSQSEYDETRLALEQAKLEVSRIQEQIDLYSRPIPGGQRAVPAEVKPGEPDSETRKEDAGTSEAADPASRR